MLIAYAARSSCGEPMPTSTIRAPRSEAARASATVRVMPTASTTRVAGPPNVGGDRTGQVTRRRIDRLRAEPGAQLPPRRTHIGDGQVVDPQPPGGEQARLPDRPAADDQHPVLRGRLAATNGVIAHGQRLHQRPQLGRHLLRQGHDVRRRHRDPFGERRRDLRGHPEHHLAAAPLRLTARAGRTVVAAHHRVDGDQLAGRESGHARAQLVDPADRLVPHHLARDGGGRSRRSSRGNPTRRSRSRSPRRPPRSIPAGDRVAPPPRCRSHRAAPMPSSAAPTSDLDGEGIHLVEVAGLDLVRLLEQSGDGEQDRAPSTAPTAST